MLESIFDERLQDKAWDQRIGHIGVGGYRKAHAVGKPLAFDLQIFSLQCDFISKRNVMEWIERQCCPQKNGEGKHHAFGLRGGTFFDQPGNRIERIEQEMRIYLIAPLQNRP